MLPVKYTPKHEVITFDWEIYIIDSAIKPQFVKDWNEFKVVEIWDVAIATSSIKTVRPAKQEISMMERILTWCSDEIKRKVREKIRQREKDWWVETDGSIKNIIEHFTN